MNDLKINATIYERFFQQNIEASPKVSVSSEVAVNKADIYIRFFSSAAANGKANRAIAPIVTDAAAIDSVTAATKDASTKEVHQGVIDEAVTKTEAVVTRPEDVPASLYRRVRSGLGKTRRGLTDNIANLLIGKKKIDADLLEEIETQLLVADVGVEATNRIVQALTDKLSRSQLKNVQELQVALKEQMRLIIDMPEDNPLESLPASLSASPAIILVIGVNGVGKTTTIGKLANRYKDQGLSVMLAAGDTFRAAAVEQLEAWGQRNDVPVIAQHTGADSASVIFDAVTAAKAREADVLIADTAGRLHTKSNLMNELQKIKRVIGKVDSTAPHEVLLVLDAGTGQNALAQAQQFHTAIEVNGVVLTKLDGTAKGGILFAIREKLGLPIRYIGVGEQAADLRPFSAKDFIDALFDTEDD